MITRIRCPKCSNVSDSPIQGGGTITGDTISYTCAFCGTVFDPRKHII